MNSIPPTDIHGIEIYSGPADVPPEYAGANSDSFCGLIIIWTRQADDTAPTSSRPSAAENRSRPLHALDQRVDIGFVVIDVE
jgi:hypothetical protein